MAQQILMASGYIYAANPNDFFHPDRQDASGTSIESFWTSLFPVAGTLKDFYLELRNTVTTQVRFNLRVNGTSRLSILVDNAKWTAALPQLALRGATFQYRRFTDLVTTVPVAAGDYVDYVFSQVGEDNLFRTAVIFET